MEPVVEDMVELGVDVWQSSSSNDIPKLQKQLAGRMTLMEKSTHPLWTMRISSSVESALYNGCVVPSHQCHPSCKLFLKLQISF